jgi:hypothetical protein
MASNFALLRAVGMKEGLFICTARHVVSKICEVSSECDVDCFCVQRVSDTCTTSNLTAV